MKFLLILLAASACLGSPVPSDVTGYNIEWGQNYQNYGKDLRYDVYPYQLVGREGIGFDKRTAYAYGFRRPLTPELLEVLRRFEGSYGGYPGGPRYLEKNSKGVYA